MLNPDLMNQRLRDLGNELEALAERVDCLYEDWEEIPSNGVLAEIVAIQEHTEVILEDVKYIRERISTEMILSDDE